MMVVSVVNGGAFTLPLMGRVALRSNAGWGEFRVAAPLSPPPDRLRRSTSPLKGEVGSEAFQ
jgi:hypothetical protein